jgi:hypothetical protein
VIYFRKTKNNRFSRSGGMHAQADGTDDRLDRAVTALVQTGAAADQAPRHPSLREVR